jgi:hypothetical protein
MCAGTLFSTLAALGLWAAPAGSVDLAKIDRSIRKEPVYQSKDPQYCLLVFGPEAKVRVWLVLDGDALYVDRNGNGDLTEPGERIEPRSALHNSPERPDAKVLRTFNLFRRIKDGQPEGEPILSCVPDLIWLHVFQLIPADDRNDARAELDRKKPFYLGVARAFRLGQYSSLAFAGRPDDAPILHIDGPRQLALHPHSQPLRRGETSWLAVELRTPGLGASVRTDFDESTEAPHPLFCTLEGKPLLPTYCRSLFARLGKKASLEKRVHPHGLRHTGAAEMRAEGADIGIISRQLGHSSIATTSRYLDHIAPEQVVQAMRKRKWSAE